MLDKNEKKEFTLLMGQVIDEKVIPRLKRLEEKSDATMEMCAKNTEDIEVIKDDVSGLKKDMKIVKEDVGIIKEDVSDLQTTSNRIETLAKSEIKYVDSLSSRVLKLETKKA